MTIPFGINLNRTLQSAVIGLASWIALSSAALAGYPDVAQEGSTLYIVGDDDGNTVTIVGAEDTPGKLAVYVHKDPWIYEGVDEINIDLAGGDNELRMARIDIAGNLTILTDDGDNRVSLGEPDNYGASFIGGDIEISTGDGPDAISIDDTWVGGNVDRRPPATGPTTSTSAPRFTSLPIPIPRESQFWANSRSPPAPAPTTFGSCGPAYWSTRRSQPLKTRIASLSGSIRPYSPIRNQRPGQGDDHQYISGADDRDRRRVRRRRTHEQRHLHGHSDRTRQRRRHPLVRSRQPLQRPREAYGQGGQDTLEEDPDNDYTVSPEFNSFEL